MTMFGSRRDDRRGLLVALSLLALFMGSLVFASSASAGKAIDRFVGFSVGSFGDEFNVPGAGSTAAAPRGVAVNEGGVGGAVAGDVYVADPGNQRIAVYAVSGAFKFVIGQDVIAEGGAGDLGLGFEKCSVASACKRGIAGSLGGEFTNPHSVAINQTTGDIYVRDRDNLRVQQFTATGAFVRAWGWDVVQAGGVGDDSVAPINEFEVCTVASQCKAGTSGAGVGQLGLTTAAFGGTGIAVAPAGSAAAGDVFVVDPQNRRVLRFNSDGTPDAVSTIGSSANFGSGSSGATTLHPLHVAVDSAGIVYASDTNSNGHIDRYNTNTSTLMTSIGASTGGVSPNPLLSNASGTQGLAVDPDSDGAGTDEDVLYVLRDPLSGNTVVQQFGPVNDPGLAAAPTASDDNTHGGSAFGTTAANGLGVDPGTGRLFVSSSTGSACEGTACHGVYVLDNDGTAATAGVTLSPATAVGATTATLLATLTTPSGLVNYRFEYSKDGVSWTAFANTRVPVTGSLAVSQPVTGLLPNATYRIRAVATKVLSPTSAVGETTAELTLVTDEAAATATTDGASQVDSDSAQLNGRVNPGGLATSYWFEWGDDNYGNQVPVPAASAGSGGVTKTVSERLSNLQPEATYHYRVCVQNSLTPSPVCGADQAFVTRPAVAAPDGRVYEMVTSPDKALRRGGDGGMIDNDYSRVDAGLPSPDGDSLAWSIFAGVSDPNSDPGFTNHQTFEIRRRTPAGWIGESAQKIAPIGTSSAAVGEPLAVSGDLETQVWMQQASLFPSLTRLSTHVMGDTGGPRGAGWYPILDPAWYQGPLFDETTQLSARVDDGGEAFVAWSHQSQANELRALTPVDGGPAPSALSPQQGSGQALFTFRSPDWRPVDLVNECTGTTAGGNATVLPSRVGTGAATDTIGGRVCEAGSPTSVRGAVMTSVMADRLNSWAPRMLSEGGRRVFFQSPDPTFAQAPSYGAPTVGGNGRTACAGQYSNSSGVPQPAAVGPLTACPAQLFLRQYDDQGEGTVRWISRAEDALFDAPQEIGMFGNGASFEGASRDGSVVYFRTNAPLTVDDINGGTPSLTTGSASHLSWDLYRYEFPDDPSADPGDGALTRISAGPRKAIGTGDATTGSPTLTNVAASTGAFVAGQAIAGPGIPANTTVQAVVATTITLSQNATATASGVALRAAADPNTNCGEAKADCGGANSDSTVAGANGNGFGGAARYVSNDGNRVYFVTTSRIGAAGAPWNAAPDGGATTPGGSAVGNVTTRNLYLYDATKTGDDAYQFIGRLPFSTDLASHAACATAATNAAGSPRGNSRSIDGLRRNSLLAQASCVHGTTSGDAIVFETIAPLTADDNDTAADVYMFNADEDQLVRLSAPSAGAEPYPCLTDGTVCNGDLGSRGGDYGEMTVNGGSSVGTDGLSHFNLAQDDAGNLVAVYFESRLGLVSGDVNGDRMDVYEWRDGELSLISPGTSGDSAFFTGSSSDGGSVFFVTEQRIDPREIDEADGDVYNARVGGGFPPPAVPPTVCAVLADGCQGAHGPGVAAEVNTQFGGGNASPSGRQTLTASVLSRKARARASRTGVLAIRVGTSAAGRVSLSVWARLGNQKTQRVARKSVQLRKAGTATVNLTLNRAARMRLRAGKALAVNVKVTQPGARGRSITVTLKRGPKS